MTTTIYIAPAAGDTHHPQCRIYACDGYASGSARDYYAKRPDLWREVGLMNYQGSLVCFDGPDVQRQELVDCQPLMAGLVLKFD